MLTLLITVIFGLAFAFFATQNASPVSLTFWKYTISGVPLYLVALIPLLFGLLVAWVFTFLKDLSQQLTISEQKDELSKEKKEEAELAREVHKLELENTKLKVKKGEDIDEDSL